MDGKSFEYKGHVFVVDAIATGNGFRWAVTIDGGVHYHESLERPLASADLAGSEACDYARRYIDSTLQDQ